VNGACWKERTRSLAALCRKERGREGPPSGQGGAAVPAVDGVSAPRGDVYETVLDGVAAALPVVSVASRSMLVAAVTAFAERRGLKVGSATSPLPYADVCLRVRLSVCLSVGWVAGFLNATFLPVSKFVTESRCEG
jgi:hypothetical protein